MNQILDAFAGLFSLTGLIGFSFGVVATLGYYRLRDLYLDRCDPEGKPHRMGFKSLTLLWAGILIFMGVLGVQQQKTANDVRALAANTAECQKQFFTVLQFRARISEENDHWSYVQRKAIADWFRDVLFPPAEIVYMREHDPGNPKYLQWGIDITTKYSDEIQQAQAEQDENFKERAEHGKLPEPTCGH